MVATLGAGVVRKRGRARVIAALAAMATIANVASFRFRGATAVAVPIAGADTSTVSATSPTVRDDSAVTATAEATSDPKISEYACAIAFCISAAEGQRSAFSNASARSISAAVCGASDATGRAGFVAA